MPQIPWAMRLAILIALAAAMIIVDLVRHPRRPTRAKEYLLLLIAGCLGAGYGAINDAITSVISPAYFVLGKGIEAGPGFRVRCILLGAQAGLSAGVAIGAVWLFIMSRALAEGRSSFRSVLAWFCLPLAGAGLLAVAFAVAFHQFDPAGLRRELARMVTPGEASAFLRVWWVHLGAYTGGLLGAVAGVLRLRARGRKIGDSVS